LVFFQLRFLRFTNPQDYQQLRFLRASRLANLKGSVGLILAKASTMRVTIPIDLSTRPFHAAVPPTRKKVFLRLLPKKDIKKEKCEK
jgi:hypothetical protein